MKTIFWGLFVLVLLILHLHRHEADALSDRTFYIIGHMANDITKVEKHLAEGANALEMDVQFSPGGRPVRTRHGIPCCFRDCLASEVFSYMLKFIKDLTIPELPGYPQQLSLIKLNLQVGSFSTEMLYSGGERVAEALLTYLFEGGFSGSNIWVLLSVPSPQEIVLFQGVRDTFRTYQMAGLLDRIGYTIGDNSDLLTIDRSFDHLGIIDHIWIGDGSSSCLSGIRSRNRVQRLVEELEVGEAHFDKVYQWTVDEPISMRTSLRTGVDAVVTNRPDRLLEILNEDEFYGRIRLATADDRPWDKVIEDESFPFNLLPAEENIDSSNTSPSSPNESPSSSLILSDDNEPAVSLDNVSLTEDGLEESVKQAKDCDSSSDSSLKSLLDDISVLGKDADTEKPDVKETTTAKPEDDVDEMAKLLLQEIESRSDLYSSSRKSISSRSTDAEDLFTKSLFSNSDNVEEALAKLSENKEVKLTSVLIELIKKLSATPETSSGISIDTLQALLNLQTTTPSPTVPLNILQAVLGRSYSNPSSNIFESLINPPAPSISPQLLRTLLDMYTPTTTPPGIPLPVVQAMMGIQPKTTSSNINFDILKLLLGTNSGFSLDSLRPKSENNKVSADVINALAKIVLDKAGASKENSPVKEVTTEASVVRRTTKGKLKGKEGDNDNKQKDSDESLLNEDLLDTDIETTTKKTKAASSNGVKNVTRNFPHVGGPPIPPQLGTKIEANIMPHGIHWKVLDKPGFGGPLLRSPNAFPFAGFPLPNNRPFGGQIGDLPHFIHDRPLMPNSGHLHSPLSYPFIGNRPLFQAHLPSKITIHQPINLHKPIRYPIKSTGQQIRLPTNINIHLPVQPSYHTQRPYMNRPAAYMYASSTPCPETLQPKPNKPEHLLFPAVRPPSLPGGQHPSHGNKPEFPSGPFPKPQGPSVHPLLLQGANVHPLLQQGANVHPLLQQGLNRPRPPVPGFDDSFESPFEPPIFFDIDDFSKKNNNTHDIPKDLFSSVKGVKETNFSSAVSSTNENGKTENFSQFSFDDLEELSEVNTKSVTTTEKSVEKDSIDDIIDELKLDDVTAKSVSTGDPFEELMTAYEKITKDKEAMEKFLRKVNLSSTLTTSAPSLRIDNNDFHTSTMLPGKSSLTQIFNLPPTAGLGWNGESINQAKLEEILSNQKQERQPIDVVVIENSPLIVVPPESATWTSLNVQKRETTPPPDDDYDEFFGGVTTPIASKKPTRTTRKPILSSEDKPSQSITISKPSEGLTKTGGQRELMAGEVEIIIPGELFTQNPNIGDGKKDLAKLGSELDLGNSSGINKGNLLLKNENINKNNVTLESIEEDSVKNLMLRDRNDQIIPSNPRLETHHNHNSRNYNNQNKLQTVLTSTVQQLRLNNVSRDSGQPMLQQVIQKSNFVSTMSPNGQRRYGGVSLRQPNVPYTIVNSVNPTTPYPKRVVQTFRTQSPKRPNVRVHYRGSGKAIENLDLTTAVPLTYHIMKSQVRKMQEQSEKNYSQMNHQQVITSQLMQMNRRNNAFTPVANNATNINYVQNLKINSTGST